MCPDCATNWVFFVGRGRLLTLLPSCCWFGPDWVGISPYIPVCCGGGHSLLFSSEGVLFCTWLATWGVVRVNCALILPFWSASLLRLRASLAFSLTGQSVKPYALWGVQGPLKSAWIHLAHVHSHLGVLQVRDWCSCAHFPQRVLLLHVLPWWPRSWQLKQFTNSIGERSTMYLLDLIVTVSLNSFSAENSITL